jgi:hypothetical protein
LHANIRQAWKQLEATIAPEYYGAAVITIANSFIVQACGCHAMHGVAKQQLSLFH